MSLARSVSTEIPMTVPVAIVLPTLNEAESLPELLDALAAQTVRPAEIIFCDAGSTDGTPEIIEAWWPSHGWEGSKLQVLHRPGALPGAGRNHGIRAAHSPWIAFLDGGIVPEHDWLERLLACAESQGAKAMFGVCSFVTSGTVARAVCALSYGFGAIHPVVPASLFRREVFDEVGFFREDLRAAEDILWVRQLERSLGPREVCNAARVHYAHFPGTLWSAAWKWYVIQQSTVVAGARLWQLIAYPLFFLGGLACVILSPVAGALLFFCYLLARGVLDPLRRSGWSRWWLGESMAFPAAIILAAMLDIAKLLGIFAGLAGMLRK